MALLSVKDRQKYLKELGYYDKKIDGIEGAGTKSAYKKLQKAYFTRSKDIDGKYGKNTDILLRSAYHCHDIKHFKLTELKCKCGGKYCTGYPAVIDRDLVKGLDNLRDYYGQPITVTSCLRCSTWNKKQGGATASRHKSGKATDIFVKGISSTFNGRKDIVNHWINNEANSRYAYCNGYANNKGKISYPKVSTMGSSVHVDVK